MNLRLSDAGRRGLGVHAWLATTLLSLCACSSGAQGEVVGAPDFPSWARVQIEDEPPPGTWRIQLLSDPQLQLGPGQESVMRVRVTDAGDAPGVGLRLSFALIGLPQDAGLAALDAITDVNGVAQNTLIAGGMATAFAVRIATPGADAVQVEVSVSNDGFGTFFVTAPYQGRRDVSRRIVSAQPRTRCDTPDDRMTYVASRPIESGKQSVMIGRLPAGVTFAVMAIAESPAQTIVARGCVDGIRVRAEQTTEVTIEFNDEAFMPLGQFAVKAELDASAPAMSLSNSLQHAAEVLVQTDSKAQVVSENAEARFLLDSLDLTLRSGAYAMQSDAMTLAQALSSARTQDDSTAELTLQQRLDGRSTGPLVAIPRIATAARTSLEGLSLFAALTLDDKDEKQPVVWQSRRIQARPTVLGGNPPSIDLARLRLAANTQSRFRGSQDKLELISVSFRAHLGALAAEVLPGAVGAVAEADAEHPDPFGCNALDEWLDAQEFDRAACDGDCLRSACDRAIARLSDAARTALIALDETRAELQLHGTFRLQDENGDLLADSMDCDELDGAWLAESDDEADAVSGSVTATAITDSSQLP